MIAGSSKAGCLAQKVFRSMTVAAFMVLASAANAQDFIGFEGKNAVREGEGGAKKTVEGVDFWSDGAPPRKFRLLGYVTDRRHKSGLIGMASMASLEKDVANVVKKNGGDAAILMASEAETVGTVGNAFGSANGNSVSAFGASRGIQKQNSKFAVVKYLGETELASAKSPEVPVAQPQPQLPVLSTSQGSAPASPAAALVSPAPSQ